MERSFLASEDPECPPLSQGTGWPPHSVPAGQAAQEELKPSGFLPVLVYPEPSPVSTAPEGPSGGKGVPCSSLSSGPRGLAGHPSPRPGR